MNHDTIAAISTSFGSAGISIIRISGDNSLDILSKIFISKKNVEEIKTHTINYGKIIDPKTKAHIDEVLVSVMKKPNTFTREDVVEINCHGGITITKKILELVVINGARTAEPGEFTKRAFINGRIDLSQAEAVMDIIQAKTLESSKAAMNQLEGKLSKRIKESRDILIEMLAHMEVNMDYPEYDIEQITAEMVYEKTNIIIGNLENAIKTFDHGRILREGLNVVIIGKPNVGKSSLMNFLSGNNKAIVTDIPGTTRDILEDYINIRGVPVKLIDTAGIRKTEDVVETIGVQRAINAISDADLIINIFDSILGISEEEYKIADEINNSISLRDNKSKIVFLINKADLGTNEKMKEIKTFIHNQFEGLVVGSENIFEASVLKEEGTDILEDFINRIYSKGEIEQNQETLVTNIRHKDLIQKSIDSLILAKDAYHMGMTLDCIALDIKNAAQFLGEITGESVNVAVMEEIFSKFCLGK